MERNFIRKAVIAGAGLMGSGISQIFSEYGINTILYSINEADFERAKNLIRKNQQTLVDNGKKSSRQVKELMDSVFFTTEKKYFTDADIIIEAIPENLSLKRDFYEEISSLAGKETIIASNTSAISINQLAKFVKYPERFCGTHFLNPPHLIPLVEITKGELTSQKTCDILYNLFLSMGKEPVLLRKDVKGFLSNRLQFALLREATYLVEQGVATPEDIDKTIRCGNGMRYVCSGPFKIADLGGLSVFNTVAEYLYPDLSNEKNGNRLLDDLVSNGKNGISTGEGFYKYKKTDLKNEEKLRDAMILGILDLSKSINETVEK